MDCAGCPRSQLTRGSGERRKLPSGEFFLFFGIFELEWTHLTDNQIGIWYFLEASYTD